jgi:CheY-like chemotaxis protein/two-component sensor histidine kinase
MSSAVEIQSAFPDRTEMVHRARDVLNRQVRHMTRLVDDLLSASRIVRGKLTLDLEPVEMRGLVQDVIEDHRSTLEAKDLALDARLPEQPTWVVGDPTRLAQAFGNLLTNAAQFTDPPGRVAVEMSVDGPAVQVAVRDTGRGLEPALLETVFEPFRQGQQGLDRKGGGLGLGLALTRGLVELMGGHADAESEGPGRGACFSIRLPITEARAQPGPPLRRVEPTRAGSVLIVEDNLDHAELLLELFRERGFSAEHTVNGRRAVERATAHPPALLICDIGLPDISGHEVARRLRPHLPDCRMVAVSGYARGQDRQRSEAAGFDAHLAKPVDVDRLIELFPPGATADLEPGNET